SDDRRGYRRAGRGARKGARVRPHRNQIALTARGSQRYYLRGSGNRLRPAETAATGAGRRGNIGAMARVVHRICPFCEACCGLELKVDEGRITAIRGDEEDVHSAGVLCPKATAPRDLPEDPDRL